MDWVSILVCVLVAVLALKFLKLIGKIIATVVLIVGFCFLMDALFDINVVQIVMDFVSKLV